MKSRRRELTDEEFVESIRQQVPGNRRAAMYGVVLLGILIVALILMYAWTVRSFREMFPGYGPGFGLGVIMGASCGLILFSLIKHLIDCVMTAFGGSSFRIHRLLLKYHDLSAEKSDDQT